MVRPIRRGERIELEQARRMVSEAEQQALIRADELRQEAEDLLRVVTTAAGQTTGAGQTVADPEEGELAALRADHEALRARVEELERALAERSPREEPERSAPPGEGQDADITLLAGAAREAEELLSAAMSAIASETARAQDAREEAERIREQARADAERIREEARRQSEDAARAGLADARRRFAEETAELRVAMERTWTSMERLLGPGAGPNPSGE